MGRCPFNFGDKSKGWVLNMQVFSKSRQKKHKRARILSMSSFVRKDEELSLNPFLKNGVVYSNSTLPYEVPNPLLPLSYCKTSRFPQGKFLSQKTLVNIEKRLSPISDPLWKRVCSEVVLIMGPVAMQIFQVEFGLPQEKSMDLYCHTKELAHLIRIYNFIIVVSLQRYFPYFKAPDVHAKNSRKRRTKK